MGAPAKKIALVGVLVVSVGALAVDRLFVGDGGPGPRGAAASPPTGKSPSPSSGAAPLEQPDAVATPAASRLSDRLRDLVDSQVDPVRRDPFALPAPWLAAMEPEKAAIESPTAPPPAPPPLAGRRLMAVVVRGQDSSAVIDGRCVRIGQKLDGMTLVRVTGNSAIFESDGLQAELLLMVPRPDRSGEGDRNRRPGEATE